MQNGILRVPDQDIILRFRELLHALRHAPDNQILPVALHGGIVQGGGHRRKRRKAFPNLPDEIVLAGQHRLTDGAKVKNEEIK